VAKYVLHKHHVFVANAFLWQNRTCYKCELLWQIIIYGKLNFATKAIQFVAILKFITITFCNVLSMVNFKIATKIFF